MPHPRTRAARRAIDRTAKRRALERLQAPYRTSWVPTPRQIGVAASAGSGLRCNCDYCRPGERPLRAPPLLPDDLLPDDTADRRAAWNEAVDALVEKLIGVAADDDCWGDWLDPNDPDEHAFDDQPAPSDGRRIDFPLREMPEDDLRGFTLHIPMPGARTTH